MRVLCGQCVSRRWSLEWSPTGPTVFWMKSFSSREWEEEEKKEVDDEDDVVEKNANRFKGGFLRQKFFLCA